MKKYILILAFVTLRIVSISQVLNHSTINNVKVSYKSMPGLGSDLSNIQCIPQATITLKANSNVSKIYFKIYKVSNNQLVYSTSYNINAETNINQNGIIIYKYSNGIINISNGGNVKLEPYRYVIQTENAQSNLSEEFEEIH